MKRIHEIGTEHAHNNFPWGWAQVGNTPGKRYKQNTHGGGIRDPLIVSWPKGIADKGSIRTQFHHVTDITPTVLEIVGVAPPDTVNGHAQMPMHGTSLVYSFPAEKKSEPTRKHAQYFEMLGHRGIWSNGWKAVAYHEAETPFDADKWELYHLEKDFSESKDLAASHPEKLAEMISLWWAEAGRNGVLPLDDRRVELWAPTPRAFNPRNRDTYVYRPPVDHIPAEGAPALGNRSFSILADIERPKTDTEGVLLSFGDAKNGLVLYVLKDRLIFDYNLYATHYRAVSPSPLPTGRMTVGVKLEKLAKGGKLTIHANGQDIATADVPYLTRRIWGAGMNIGCDDGLAVASDYAAPFPFTGTLHHVTLDVPPMKPSKADQRQLARAELSEQ